MSSDLDADYPAFAAWRKICSATLVAWKENQDFGAGIAPIAPEVIARATAIAVELLDNHMDAPTSIVPDQNGGIVFRFQDGESVHVFDDGSVVADGEAAQYLERFINPPPPPPRTADSWPGKQCPYCNDPSQCQCNCYSNKSIRAIRNDIKAFLAQQQSPIKWNPIQEAVAAKAWDENDIQMAMVQMLGREVEIVLGDKNDMATWKYLLKQESVA